MNQPEPQGIFYSADLPLSWVALGNPQPSGMAQWQHEGVMLLRALSVIEMPVPEFDREDTAPAGKAVERMEAKLDLTLSLVMQLVRQQTGLPPPCAVTLRADCVEWADQNPPGKGQALLVSLYLSPKLPLPLTLPARVAGSESMESGGRVVAAFIDMSEEMRDWLERTLFRHHRRNIQQSHSRRQGET